MFSIHDRHGITAQHIMSLLDNEPKTEKLIHEKFKFIEIEAENVR